jgi:hypothetical protein
MEEKSETPRSQNERGSRKKKKKKAKTDPAFGIHRIPWRDGSSFD